MQAERCRTDLREAQQAGTPIVYLDETVFTTRTYQHTDYGLKRSRIEIKQSDADMKYICAIACISHERGLFLHRTYNKAVDQVIFAEFLQQLSREMGGLPFVLFMDRLSVHLCTSVKEKMKELQITAILNVSYSPQYNPIE